MECQTRQRPILEPINFPPIIESVSDQWISSATFVIFFISDFFDTTCPPPKGHPAIECFFLTVIGHYPSTYLVVANGISTRQGTEPAGAATLAVVSFLRWRVLLRHLTLVASSCVR